MKTIFQLFCKLIIVVLFATNYCQAQFPFISNLDAKGTIITSPPTIKNIKYKIIVEGTFSIWPEFLDCRGFDAGYVYEAPQEEIDNYRWPPEEIIIAGNKIEIFKLPKWVGDSTLYQIPPPYIATPIFELSMKKQKGLRMNGEPIPNLGYDSINHKYEYEIIGDGNPIIMQIIDSNYSIQDKIYLPRYEDNCGFLTIQIIDTTPKDSVITKQLCNSFFEPAPLLYYHLDISVYFKKNYNNDIRNIIADGAEISLSFDNQVFSPIYTECDIDRTPADILYLIDNSGSMLAGTTKEDTVQRIDEAKNIILRTLDYLIPNDNISLFSFNDESVKQLDWDGASTSAIDDIKVKLNSIIGGNRTNIIKGINSSVAKFDSLSSQSKVLFIFSDFADNFNQDPESDIINLLNQKYIKSLIINFAQGGNETDIKSNQLILGIEKDLTNGYIFGSKDTSDIYRKFKEVSGIINDTNCCDVVFQINPCHFNKDTTINSEITIKYQDSTYKFSQEINFKCNKSGFIQKDNIEIEYYANSKRINVVITGSSNGSAFFNATDILGNTLMEKELNVQMGINYYSLYLDNILNGISIININYNGISKTFKIIK